MSKPKSDGSCLSRSFEVNPTIPLTYRTWQCPGRHANIKFPLLFGFHLFFVCL